MPIRYASPTGNSGNTGISEASPWSYEHAVDQLAAGMDIVLTPGSYPQYAVYQKSGAAGNPGIIRSQYKWQAIMEDHVNHGLWIAECHNLVFDGIRCRNNAQNGISIPASSVASTNITIRNSWCHNNVNMGVYSGHLTSNNIFEYNLIELNGGAVGFTHGLYTEGLDHIIRSNVVRNNVAWGIHVYDGNGVPSGYLIYNNLTYGHGDDAFGCVVFAANGSGVGSGTNYLYGNTFLDGLQLEFGTAHLHNNIVFPSQLDAYSQAHPVRLRFPTGTPTLVADHNLSNMALDQPGANDVVVANLAAVGFVNSANGLYWLNAGSPARGEATSAAGKFGAVDFFGNAQASVADIGAFQHAALLAADTRVLDPSPADPNYWEILSGAALRRRFRGRINVRPR